MSKLLGVDNDELQQLIDEAKRRAKAPTKSDKGPASTGAVDQPQQPLAQKPGVVGGAIRAAQAVGGAAAAAGKATVEGVKTGGQHVANAIVPPPGTPEGAASRGGEAALGALHTVMSLLGVTGGAAALQELASRTGHGDEPIPVPPRIHELLRTADALFQMPELVLNPKSADLAHDPQAQAAFNEQMSKPYTWNDLAALAGSVLGPAAVHGAVGAAGAERAPSARTRAQEAAKAAYDAKVSGQPPKDIKAAYEASLKRGQQPGAASPGASEAMREANRRGQGAAQAPAPEVPPSAAPEAAYAGPERRAEGGDYAGPERRAVHEGTVPPAEAKGIEPIPEAVNADTSELQASLAGEHAIISAERPGLSPEENAARSAALKADLEAKGVNPIPARGVYGGGSENSFFATGLSLADAAELGSKYDQESVIHNGDLHYVTGEHTGKVRKNLGTTFGDIPDDADRTEIGNARFTNRYDWESDPVAQDAPGTTEPPAPAQPQPAVEGPSVGSQESAAPGEEAVEVAPAAEEATPDTTLPPVQDVENQAGTPEPTRPVQTVADAQQLAAGAAAAAPVYGPPTAAEYTSIRAAGQELAKQLRDSGAFTEAQIRDAVRSHLNEHGIFSKRQLEAKAAEKIAASEEAQATHPAEAAHNTPLASVPAEEQARHLVESEPSLREAIDQLKARIQQLGAKIGDVLGNEGGGVGNQGTQFRGDIAEAGKLARATFNDLTTIGAAILARVKSEAKWRAEMIKEFGASITRHLPDLFKASSASLADLKTRFPGMLTPRDAVALYRKGKAALLWYDKAPEELAKQYGEENVGLAADAYAATSIGTAADAENIDYADKAIRMILSGERNGLDKPFTFDDGVSGGKAQQAQLAKLNAVARGEVLTGPKIGPYADTLKGIRDPNLGYRPVLDSWMGRLFGFTKDGWVTDYSTGKKRWVEADAQGFSPTPEQRAYMDKVINDVAAQEGVAPHQVQAAMWAAYKAQTEIRRYQESPGWKNATPEERQAKIDEINGAHDPFHVLLQNRLWPAVEAAIVGEQPVDMLARKASNAIIKDTTGDPVNAATYALQKSGLALEKAKQLALSVYDYYKASGLADETGAISFWKRAEDEFPFDEQASRAETNARLEADPDLQKALRADVKKPMTQEAVDGSVAAARRAGDRMRGTLDADTMAPGQLYHDAVVTGIAADRARVATGRWGEKADPGKVWGGTKPINDAVISKFARDLHEQISEPELMRKLDSLPPVNQERWLANLFRASQGAQDGSTLAKLYMTLYTTEKLTSLQTPVKAAISHTMMLPLDLVDHYFGGQIGKVFKGVTDHVYPGEAGVRMTAMVRAVREQIALAANDGWDGIRTQMVTEGESHPPIWNSHSSVANIFNAVAGAATDALGAMRSSFKVIARAVDLAGQGYSKALEEANRNGLDQAQLGELIEHYRQNPTDDMLRHAADMADEMVFTKKIDGPIGELQSMGADSRAMYYATRLLISPFPRVELGIMDRTMQMTPGLNFLSGNWWRMVNEGGRSRDLAFGRLATGVTMLLVADQLASQGVCTGDGPNDRRSMEIAKMNGFVPNVCYIGGKPVSHLALGPISGILAAAADARMVWHNRDEQTWGQFLFSTALAIADPLTHAGYFQAIGKLVEAIHTAATDDAKAAFDWVEEKVADLALLKPAGAKQAADMLEDSPRTASRGPGAGGLFAELKYMRDQLLKDYPGYSEGAPTLKNFLTYEPIPIPGLMHTKVVPVGQDRVAAEIDRLGMNSGHLRYAITRPSSYIMGRAQQLSVVDPSTSSTGVPLSAWQYDRLLQIMGTELKDANGNTLHAALEAAIDSPEYKAKKDKDEGPTGEGGKAFILYGIYKGFESAARAQLLAEDEHLMWLADKAMLSRANPLTDAGTPDVSPGPEPEPRKYPLPGQRR